MTSQTMFTDACCTRAGWVELIGYNRTDGTDIHLSVHPETDLQSDFVGFWHDYQEMISITGRFWTFKLVGRDEVAA